MGAIAPQLAEKAFLDQLPYLETHISEILKESRDMWSPAPTCQCSFGGYRFFQNTLYVGG